MKALIINNKSEIGFELAKKLSDIGYDIIYVSKYKRGADKLEEAIKTNLEIISLDVASTFNCEKLYKKFKDEDIDVLINNNEMVLSNKFIDEKIDDDLDLIDVNIKSVHTLTKLFLQKFEQKGKGYILNIFSNNSDSITYKASIFYISNLTYSLTEEIRRKKLNINLSLICSNKIDIDNIIEKISNNKAFIIVK